MLVYMSTHTDFFFLLIVKHLGVTLVSDFFLNGRSHYRFVYGFFAQHISELFPYVSTPTEVLYFLNDCIRIMIIHIY